MPSNVTLEQYREIPDASRPTAVGRAVGRKGGCFWGRTDDHAGGPPTNGNVGVVGRRRSDRLASARLRQQPFGRDPTISSEISGCCARAVA